MPDRLMRARLYRQRAEEIRAIARDWVKDETMQRLAKLASDYEKMAENLEQSAKAEGTEPKN